MGKEEDRFNWKSCKDNLVMGFSLSVISESHFVNVTTVGLSKLLITTLTVMSDVSCFDKLIPGICTLLMGLV